MKKLFFLFSIFAIILSCSSDETSTPVTPPAPIVKYTITLSAGEGGTVSTTGGEYEAGQTVSVTATPQGEYVFTSWSDGNTNATRTITIGSNSTLTANFEKRKYPLTINFEGEGEVIEEIVNAGRTTDYDSGTTVKLTAVPAEGWEFVGWTGAIESEELEVQLLVSEAKEINAEFKELEIVSISIEDPKEILIVSHKFSPIVFANFSNGEKLDISSNVKISSLNKKTTILPDNTIIGAIKGDEKLIFDYKEHSTSLDIYINNIEFEELDSKFLEVKESTIKVPFLMINIFPTNDGIIHNDTIGPSSYWDIKNPPLETSKSKIKNILLTSKNAIELGTAFRDYGENKVKPYVSMLPLAYINIYVSNENEYKTKKTWNNRQTYDYIKMFSDLEIENYVNTKALKEIWITDFPYGGYPSLTNSGLYNEQNDTWLPESNMASPFTGDVSNSYRIPDDLPVYNNTYVVYGNSGHRGVDTNIHNRGHQIESQLRYIEKNKKSGQELFWNKFVGVDESGNQAMNKRSGNTHFPPNAKSDYEYCNEEQIESDIFNWTPEGGDKQQVKCGSWRNLSLNFTYNKYSDDGISGINNDPHTKWLITWFQSIPGENNNIPYLRDGRNYKLTNWWDLFYNWDNAINQNKTLWTNASNEETNIYLDENGITIKAESWAKVGDNGIINGVLYTVVDEEALRVMIANNEDVTKVVTTKVTNMNNLFKGKSSFNQQITSWDVSNVTTLRDAFHSAETFNQNLNNWDVSNVEDFAGVFNGAISFNGDISNWNVSSGTDFIYMFHAARDFNQDIGNWVLVNLVSTERMFAGAYKFNQDISSWDMSNNSNMGFMFYDAKEFNQDLSSWCVTKIATAPTNFDTNATAWTLPKPVWGTCPE